MREDVEQMRFDKHNAEKELNEKTENARKEA